MTLRETLKEFYDGETSRAYRFRYGLLAFDIVTIAFIIASSFATGGPWVEVVDILIGVVLGLDFAVRMWIARHRIRYLLHPYGIIDIIVIISLLAPIVGEGLALLRIARVFRLLRSYQVLRRLRQDFTFFARNEQTVQAALNLGVFIFIMTAIVYESQHYSNEQISNYADSLYFTVTALTTTGFGDITLKGAWGRMLSVIIMIFGVSLFLRLVQVMLRPQKVEHTCPDCGLKRHDVDAVHCKACGRMLKIEDEGVD
ncbi:MAG: potassium channel family protein [Aestuariivirga sp.]